MIEKEKELVKKLLKTQEKCFVEDYKPTEEELMGMVLSHYFEWNGLAILKTAYWALEDSNFHTENKSIQEMIDRIEGRLKPKTTPCYKCGTNVGMVELPIGPDGEVELFCEACKFQLEEKGE